MKDDLKEKWSTVIKWYYLPKYPSINKYFDDKHFNHYNDDYYDKDVETEPKKSKNEKTQISSVTLDEWERNLQTRERSVVIEARKLREETEVLEKKEKQVEDRLKDLLKKEASIKLREDELHKRMEEIEEEVQRLKKAAEKIDAEIFKRSDLYELLG